VTLPASAAESRAVAPLPLSAGRAAVGRYLLAAGRTAANSRQRSGRATDGTDGQTDGQTPD